jgi:sodium transport system ATP-binding protein
MIDIQNLHKHFIQPSGVLRAVNGLSLQGRDGRITGLLGANGAGKTTTLRMLAGLLKPDSGCRRCHASAYSAMQADSIRG